MLNCERVRSVVFSPRCVAMGRDRQGTLAGGCLLQLANDNYPDDVVREEYHLRTRLARNDSPDRWCAESRSPRSGQDSVASSAVPFSSAVSPHF